MEKLVGKNPQEVQKLSDAIVMQFQKFVLQPNALKNKYMISQPSLINTGWTKIIINRQYNPEEGTRNDYDKDICVWQICHKKLQRRSLKDHYQRIQNNNNKSDLEDTILNINHNNNNNNKSQ